MCHKLNVSIFPKKRSACILFNSFIICDESALVALLLIRRTSCQRMRDVSPSSVQPNRVSPPEPLPSRIVSNRLPRRRRRCRRRRKLTRRQTRFGSVEPSCAVGNNKRNNANASDVIPHEQVEVWETDLCSSRAHGGWGGGRWKMIAYLEALRFSSRCDENATTTFSICRDRRSNVDAIVTGHVGRNSAYRLHRVTRYQPEVARTKASRADVEQIVFHRRLPNGTGIGARTRACGRTT